MAEYEASEWLRPYSLRDTFSVRAHGIVKDDGDRGCDGAHSRGASPQLGHQNGEVSESIRGGELLETHGSQVQFSSLLRDFADR